MKATKILACLAFLLPFAQENGAQGRKVNVNGKEAIVPTSIERIADAWPAHNMVLYMLGYGDKIVATSVSKRMCPWFYKINPAMHRAVTTFAPSGDSSMEELVKAKPDIVFLTRVHANADFIRSMGYPVVELSFSDFEGMQQCVLATGDVLGKEARIKAEKYVGYLKSTIRKIQQSLFGIAAEEKPKVLHITSLSPITVSGRGIIMDEWIKLCGGVNAAAEVEMSKPVSSEQVLLWNPDVIIYANASTSITEQDVLLSSTLKSTKAGKTGKIYINPKGLFSWDRYSIEEALQIQWAAQKFFPDRFQNVDIVAETIRFYREFFDYALTREEAAMIIKGIAPNEF
ncbi:MAG: ABC transporter substrate-binding protein [Prevotellaceae bacterium]|jgi:iron complex transport system substrate-binding protein|nr:ABC transporter substrate-binding protein [Prevotellaceae bacterium]